MTPMNRITDYKLVESDERTEIEKKVQELIAKGWQPLGGISTFQAIGPDGCDYSGYAQAMVIYAE